MQTWRQYQLQSSLLDVLVTRPPVFETPDDDRTYWAANPDIASCGLSASQHYARHGHLEGRMQAANEAEVAAIRERKLRKVAFRQAPALPRSYGKPADFMTDALRREFHIPTFPPISAHDYGSYIPGLQKEHPDWMFLDVGAGLRQSVSDSLINVDVFDSLSTDVICVGENLPFEDAQFDFVLCAATLEHTRRPWEVAAEISRVLKPGGIARIDYPFLQPVHGYPSHYFNATPEGSISLFEPWCDIRSSMVDDHFHPVHALRWMMEVWRNTLPGDASAQFAAMTVDDFLSSEIPELMQTNICKLLPAEAQKILCAGTTLEVVKKAGHHYYGSERERRLAHDVHRFERDIEIIRSSTSWKVTAPLRRVIATMRKVIAR